MTVKSGITAVYYFVLTVTKRRKLSGRCTKISATQRLFTKTNDNTWMQPQDDAIIAYIGGWLVRKIACSQCSDTFLKNDHAVPFFKYKTYLFANQTSLKSPSAALINIIKKWEQHFRSHIKKVCNQPNIVKTDRTFS
jgi:hypothetical protein